MIVDWSEKPWMSLKLLAILWFLAVVVWPQGAAWIRAHYQGGVPFGTEINLTELPSGRRVVLYTIRAPEPMRGDWAAWVEVDGERICGGSGTATYGAQSKITHAYSVPYFLGRSCDPPPSAWRLCASYRLADQFGYARNYGPFCSATQPPSGGFFMEK
jgi:hypothetical protein